jgi:hypothetical protein
MSKKLSACVALLIVVMSGCTPEEKDDVATPSQRPGDATPLIASLPDDCAGIGRTPGRGEVTFIHEGRLYGASSTGRNVRCLGRVSEGTQPAWGGSGDRFFVALSGSRSRVLFRDRDVTLTPGVMQPLPYGLSRPRGLSTLFASANRRHLYKMPTQGGPLEEISFLKRHDEAVYHPAGEHIAVVGEAHDGTYGIFLATNLGTEPQLLVVGEDAKRIYSLSFAQSGFLYYAAEHEDHHDVHGVSLFPAGEGDVGTSKLRTYFSTPDTITKVVSSPFVNDGKLAIQVASGEDDCPSQIVLYSRRDKAEGFPFSGDISTAPVGWLPNGDLAFVTLDEECDTKDLYAFHGFDSSLLVEGADAVAVRGILPPAPGPPTRFTEVVA